MAKQNERKRILEALDNNSSNLFLGSEEEVHILCYQLILPGCNSEASGKSSLRVPSTSSPRKPGEHFIIGEEAKKKTAHP